MNAVFALILTSLLSLAAHAEFEVTPVGLDLTGLELESVDAYASCSIGQGSSRIQYFLDVERYDVVGKEDAKRPCQLIYTKQGAPTVQAWARVETPEKCYQVADGIVAKLEARGAYCEYGDIWE